MRSDLVQKILDQTKACNGFFQDARAEFQFNKEDRHSEISFGHRTTPEEVEQLSAAISNTLNSNEDPTKRKFFFDGVSFPKVADFNEWCKQTKQEINKKYISYV
jgi:hypothetical protein